MRVRYRLLALAMTLLATPTLAQQSGGLLLAPGIKGGPTGLARPLPFVRQPLVTAQGLQNGMGPADHQAQNQAMIQALRGDAGFLAGFQFGTPLAASRQLVQTMPDDAGYSYRRRHHGQGNGPIIINNGGPLAVTVGNGNVVQQQLARTTGPVAQQQVVNMPGAVSGGAVNLAGATSSRTP